VSDTSGTSHDAPGPNDGSAPDAAHDDAEVAHRDAEAAHLDASTVHHDAETVHHDAEQMHRDAEEMRVDARRAHREADEESFGPLGRPMRHDSPIRLGFLGALGVFLAWFLIQAIIQARSVLILIVVSLFLAVGLNPIVESLTRRGLRRTFAIAIVFFIVIGAFVAFGFAVVPPVAEQSDEFVKNVPGYLEDLRGNSTIRQFDDDYGVIEKAQAYVTSGDLGERLFGGILGVGRIVVSAVFGAVSVLILTLYFLASLPSMKRQAYRLVPATRRERVQLLTDEILTRIGGFVSGALTVAFIAALTSYIFLRIVDLPYALALAVFVGLLDLIPLVGATIAAIGVTTLGFIESPGVGLACLIFYVAYQQFENYVLYPRVMRSAVDVPAAVTVVAVLIGGALLGVVGALLAIPAAAAVLLVVRQVAIPRMDQV
jgi:predicted PurR-regulated permease PerM